MPTAISIDGLGKRYRIGEYQAAYGTLRDSIVGAVKRVGRHERHADKEIWAVRDITLDVEQGEVIGIIGRNGAGKSTLLRLLTRITAPTTGMVTIRGRVGSLLEVGTGFHPELTGRENIFLNGSILGMRRKEITSRFDEIVEFAGVETFIDTPVKRYSSGMYVRLAFSVAAHLEPEILLVDEVLAVGDAEFQKRCLGRMEDMSTSGRTIVFVSHQMQAVSSLCNRVVLLEKGSVKLDGGASDVVARYLQEHAGAGSARVWPDLATAPGDDLVRLRGARAILEDGSPAHVVDVRQPVGIEIAFTVLRDGPSIAPKLKVVNGQGQIAFNALDTNPRWRGPARAGDYTSTAWIPGNLLNEGLMLVDVAVAEYAQTRFHHHAGVREALSFHVQDPGELDSARGAFLGQWKGAVRPMLDWVDEER